MHVFVTGTGRCGTTTFAKACEHITNYTSAHEGPMRPSLDYPRKHIEISPHLSWVMPALVAQYPSALFIHLRRKREEVIDSWIKRGNQRGPGRWARAIHLDVEPYPLVCTLNYYVTVAQIENYRGRCDLRTLWLHEMKQHWERFWEWIRAEGDFAASLAEWDIKHNSAERNK